ncbi:MAG TPA: AI-2E family transporter [Candidatus Omnitrophota bacterium]|nr:AI-2E family transporter [Candidatus Omnitrophota bacterium]HPS36359.1 AI-2E family transporter [Candidatus Omnitrophota bacterium]
MKREQFISFFFIAVLVFIVYEICRIFSPFFTAIFWAAILSFGFYPIYARLKKAFPKRNNSLALLMTLVVFLVVIPPLAVVLVNLATQAIELSQWAYSYVRDGKLEQLIEHVRASNWIQNIESHVFQWEPLKKNASTWLLNIAKTVGNTTAAQAGTLTKNAFFILLNLFFMIFLTFIFFKHGDRIYNFIYQIAPFEKDTKKAVFDQVVGTFEAVIRGQLLTSLIQAIVSGLLFWMLGIPLPVFFAFLTFIVSMIPIPGASGVWFPLVIYLVANQMYLKAGILLALGFGVISTLDNIIKPAIIGERTKLPYFLLFFGIMGGMKLFGLMGIFLAPAVLSIFFALIKIYREKYL